MIRNKANAPHYLWQSVCDGWPLVEGRDLSFKEERMPPGTAERCHRHQRARQVFYVLSGQLTMELDGALHRLSSGDALEIPPGLPHQARNESEADTGFLVVSVPPTAADREDL